jgi:23S rRNA (adenine2503-C2)-methyltransferase
MFKKNLLDFDLVDLTRYVTSIGEKPYRASQVYGWLFKKGAASINDMTDVSKAFRELLGEGFYIGVPEVIDTRTSVDGTRKFLLELTDGEKIESVLIPEEDRMTLCVSTQAGCALGCRFCLTGEGGPGRNLTLSELVGQVLVVRTILKDEKLTNVVLMGMGEPFLNLDNVIKFLRVLTDDNGLEVAPRKVTVSTSGIVPGIERLGKEELNVNLAISLNATDDATRTRVMPINKKYPLEVLMGALRNYPLKKGKSITIEYVMLGGVNDTPEDMRRLVKLLRRIPVKINLIPFNPYEGGEFSRPTDESILAFHKHLLDAGYTVITRSSKGADILAACGQLKGAVG